MLSAYFVFSKWSELTYPLSRQMQRAYPMVGMQRANRSWGLTWRITAYNAPWPRIAPKSHARCSISRRERDIGFSWITQPRLSRSGATGCHNSRSCYKIQQFILATILTGTVLHVSLRRDSPKDRHRSIFIIIYNFWISHE